MSKAAPSPLFYGHDRRHGVFLLICAGQLVCGAGFIALGVGFFVPKYLFKRLFPIYCELICFFADFQLDFEELRSASNEFDGA